MKPKNVTPIILLAFAIPTVLFAQTDYILQNNILHVPANTSTYSPVSWDALNDSTAVLRWCMAPVVTPGQTVKVLVHWKFWTNHVPVFYMNYFGDWQPNVELAQSQMYGGIPYPNQQFVDTFNFTAPSTPGWYRIRFMQRGWYNPVTNFYGTPSALPNCYTEMIFRVGYPINGVMDEQGSIHPQQLNIVSCTPNPFKENTRIFYTLSNKAKVTIKIYSTSGRIVREIFEGLKQVGNHELFWDGYDDDGKKLPAGTYFYSIDANGFTIANKTVLIN